MKAKSDCRGHATLLVQVLIKMNGYRSIYILSIILIYYSLQVRFLATRHQEENIMTLTFEAPERPIVQPAPVSELWYTRCPVPTASGVALELGWLAHEFGR